MSPRPLILLLMPACAGPNLTRGADDMRRMSAAEAMFEVPVGLPADALAAGLPRVADAMGLDVEEEPSATSPDWLLWMGPRLNDGPLWYRVAFVARDAEAGGGTLVRVHAAPSSWLFSATGESIGKPAELAARLVAAAAGAAGGAR